MRKGNILILAPNSFPINGPEGIVNSKLIYSLTRAGYKIDVISKYNKNSYMPSELDTRFSEGLNKLIQISVDNKISFSSIVDHIKVLVKTGYVYKGAHWAYYAIRAASKLIEETNYDYILSRNPPSELAALFISQKYNIPWIANWNDPYPEVRMPIPYGKGPKGFLTPLQNKLLKRVCDVATLHSFPSKRQREYMLSYMNISLEKTKIIPHICYDNLISFNGDKDNSKLRIIHSGNVSYPRDPRYFINGVKAFLDENPQAQIEINFIGNQSSNFKDLISSELQSIIKILEALPYLENLKLIAKHHVALIIEAPSENSVFLPTKVGDYMQCMVEIFAISPSNGVLHDLYSNQKIGYFADCEDAMAIKDQLSKMYKVFETTSFYNLKREIINEYGQEHIMNIYNKLLQ